MKVVVIDGQGGKLGGLIVETIKKNNIDAEIYGIGTNSIATAAMIKAGAEHGATGENPIIVACRDADIIIGPVGIVAADSMLGEITPSAAVAVGKSPAKKLLLPVNHCNLCVVGMKKLSMAELVREAVDEIKGMF